MLPMDNYLMDLNSGQSYYRPSYMLVAVLKHPDTACNAMLEAFGAPRFNLLTLTETLRRRPELRVEWVAAPGPIVTACAPS